MTNINNDQKSKDMKNTIENINYIGDVLKNNPTKKEVNVITDCLNNIFSEWVAASTKLTTSPEVLELLHDHKKDFIRTLVALNPKTSENTLEKMTNDSQLTVLKCLFKNPNLNLTTLNTLSKNENYEIREAVTKYSIATIETIESLCSDDNRYVRQYARKRYNELTGKDFVEEE